MKNIYDKYEDIFDSRANGAISQMRHQIKDLTRAQRYEIIMYAREEVYDKRLSDEIMKICILADFK